MARTGLMFFLALCFTSSAIAFGLPWEREIAACNGHAELCSRSYGNTTFLGAHNSFAHSTNPFALARTQEVDVAAQLKLGVRLLQGQTHLKDGKINLCHTSCDLFNGGALSNYLASATAFLSSNPNEVLTIILTNPENLSLRTYFKPAFDTAGLTPLVYSPALDSRPVKRSAWPTLGEMIASGKRVIVFLDQGADTGAVDFILPEFPMLWENPFSVTDPAFPCKVDRSAGPLSTVEHLSLINHVLNLDIIPIGDGVLISDRPNAPETNSVKSIIADSNECTSFTGGNAPNFVLLDYVNVGDGMQTVNLLNGF